jgi:hypothetical protein
MRFSRIATVALTLAALVPALSASAQQKLVVSHDEWLTSGPDNSALFFNANEQQFVSNSLDWFGLSGGGTALIYSNDQYLGNHTFTDWLAAKGFTVTSNAAESPTNFGNYDVIFAEGNPTYDPSGLTAYVMGGGNVMYMGGTGIGGSAVEAAYSNAFLNSFGLSFANVYNGLGTVNTSGFAGESPFGAALFHDVPSVYANNGNDISSFSVAGVTNQVFYDERQHGVFAAAQVTATPEPASLTLLVTGLLGIVGAARQRRARRIV